RRRLQVGSQNKLVVLLGCLVGGTAATYLVWSTVAGNQAKADSARSETRGTSTVVEEDQVNNRIRSLERQLNQLRTKVHSSQALEKPAEQEESTRAGATPPTEQENPELSEEQ